MDRGSSVPDARSAMARRLADLPARRPLWFLNSQLGEEVAVPYLRWRSVWDLARILRLQERPRESRLRAGLPCGHQLVGDVTD